MEDNPSLSTKTLTRYKSQYSGVFYERYILGRWVVAEGLVVAVPVNGSVEHPAVAHISEPAIANETNARMM